MKKSLSDKREHEWDSHPETTGFYKEKFVKQAVQEIEAWAIKWGYKGVSPDCMKELHDIVGEKLTGSVGG